jgi:hypothetical protein
MSGYLPYGLSFEQGLGAALIAGVGAYLGALGIARLNYSPLSTLPGPPSVSFLHGSFKEVPEADAYRLIERWTGVYGHTFSFRSFFNVSNPHDLNKLDLMVICRLANYIRMTYAQLTTY